MSRLTCRLGVALVVVVSALASQARAQFIPIFNIIQLNGPAWKSGDEAKWAKYVYIDIDRDRYNQITSDTYGLIHSLNPTEIICIYQQGADVWTGWSSGNYEFDNCPVLGMNNIARYRASRGHSMGDLTNNNPDLFLLKSDGERCHTFRADYRFLMDFGSTKFINYWGEATVADLGRSNVWHGDGIFIDNCAPLQAGYSCDTPAKYSTDAAWSAAMMTWHTGLAAYLRKNGLKSWTNSGNLDSQGGFDFYRTIDSDPNAPDIMTDEGVFVHGWGSAGASFHSEAKWKRQVDILGVMQHVKLAQFSHVKFTEGGTSTDNYGKSLTYWDALWYAMGSMALGMNDQLKNSALYFQNYTDPQHAYWYDEYDKLDLGPAVGPYTQTSNGGVHQYSREFQKGYVYVNVNADSMTITLPEPCRQPTHETINQDPSTWPVVTSITLDGHRAAFLFKATSVTAPATQPATGQ